jgi:hypothetical protein
VLLGAAAGPAAATDGDDVAPMRFSIVAAGEACPGCVVINASGEITDETAREFALFLAESRLAGLLPKEPRRGTPRRADGAKIVVAFQSIGGKVLPALIMGRRIRQLGWTTVVGRAVLSDAGVHFERAGCYSACSMVMLGGVERYVVPGSKPGVHQFSPQFEPNETYTANEMNAIVRDYARQVVGVYDYVAEMGVDVSFFIATMRTPFASMDVLDRERWTKLGFATGKLAGRDGAALRDILGNGATTGSVAATERPPIEASPDATAVAAVDPTPARWTVGSTPEGGQSARFSDRRVSLSLACTQPNEAKLELTFKDLDPNDLEHLRAAAFSMRRLSFAERQIAIASVAAPGRGEQALAAVLDTRDLRALQGAEGLTFAVLDRSGRPAAHAASVSSDGAAKAIADVMASCGGV